jgi:hypothetical protein
MRILIPSEQNEAITLVEYCKLKNIRLVSIPNGFASTPKEGARQKKLGLCAGFPDYLVPYARGNYHAMFIELKRKSGGYASAVQQEWLSYLNGAGFLAMTCLGSEHAVREIERYLAL